MILQNGKRVLNGLKPGSVLGVARSVYDHYGILMDDGKIIHYTSADSDISNTNVISRTPLSQFLRGRRHFWTMRFPSRERAAQILGSRMDRLAAEPAGRISPAICAILSIFGREGVVRKMLKEYRLYSPEEIQERATSRIGERRYNPLTRNCEHFAFWCATGFAASQQVDSILHGGAEIASSLLIGTFHGIPEGKAISSEYLPALFEKKDEITLDENDHLSILPVCRSSNDCDSPVPNLFNKLFKFSLNLWQA